MSKVYWGDMERMHTLLAGWLRPIFLVALAGFMLNGHVFAASLKENLQDAERMMEQGDDKEAMRLLSESIDSGKLTNSQLAHAYRLRSAVNVSHNRFRETIADASMAIKYGTQSPYAYYNRGFAYCMTGKVEMGLADLKSAQRYRSDEESLKLGDPTPFYDRGACYLEKQLYREALAELDKAAIIAPDNALVLANRGGAYMGLGEYDRALSNYQAAARFSPNDPELHYNLGEALLNLGRTKDAMAAYNRALVLNPEYASALFKRGAVFNLTGKYDLALQDLDKTIRLYSQDPNVYYQRGISYAGLGKYDLAIRDYGVALKADTDNPSVRFSRGVAYFQKGDYQRAIPDFDAGIREPSQDMEAHFFRGASWYILGQFAKADADFNYMLEHNKGDARVPYMLISITYARAHNSADRDLKQEIAKLKLDGWPGPILAQYLGKLTPDEVLAAARAGDHHECEANFYVGEYELQRGNNKVATLMLKRASDLCEKIDFEQKAAQAELERTSKEQK